MHKKLSITGLPLPLRNQSVEQQIGKEIILNHVRFAYGIFIFVSNKVKLQEWSRI